MASPNCRTGCVSLLAVAEPLVDDYVEPELVQGVDYVDWWDEAELRAILRAFATLARDR